MKQVIKDMQNSPTAAYLRELSFHERVMLVAVIVCVRKEGVEEIRWGDVSEVSLPLLVIVMLIVSVVETPASPAN